MADQMTRATGHHPGQSVTPARKPAHLAAGRASLFPASRARSVSIFRRILLSSCRSAWE